MSFSPPALILACLAPLVLAWYTRSLSAPRAPVVPAVLLFLLGGFSVMALPLLPSAEEDAIRGISDPYLRALADAFLTAALPEELCRFLLVVLVMWITRRSSDPMRGMAFGGFLGAGFALWEGLLGALGNEELLRVGVGRTLGAIGHWSSGVIMGYFLGLAGLHPARRTHYLASALAVPTILHTLYDFGILAEVPGALEVPDEALPPWPALALMGLVVTSWTANLVWASVAIRRTSRMRGHADEEAHPEMGQQT